MDNYVLKNLLGGEYTENPIVNFLLYCKKDIDTLPTPQKMFKKNHENLNALELKNYTHCYNQWRIKNDLDVIYLNGDLNADTIFSIWMPLKMCLQSSLTYPYSEHGVCCKPYKNSPYLPNIIKNIDKYLPYSEWSELYKFVELALTDANIMRLPNQALQKRSKYYDQMPKTLYECFDGGEFYKYFNDVTIEDWIKDNNLFMFFEDGVALPNKIKPLISRMKASEFEWLEHTIDIKEMLINYINILELRINWTHIIKDN